MTPEAAALEREIAGVLPAMMAAAMFDATFDPIAFRATFEAMAPVMWPRDDLDVADVRDIEIAAPQGHQIPARLYRPRLDPQLPVLLFFHGGGFVSGSVETAESHARFLAREADCAVLSVSYRLAPEHPFPAGLEDGVTALRWLTGHAAALDFDPQRIAIGGDAPGATLATTATLVAAASRDQLPQFQFLLAPAADFAGTYPEKHRNLALGPVSQEALELMEGLYLPDPGVRVDWRCSPLLAPHLDQLPPTFIMAGEFDFLAPEIDAYAMALREAGVPVVYHRWPGAIHNFFSMVDQFAIARIAMQNAAFQLHRALHA